VSEDVQTRPGLEEALMPGPSEEHYADERAVSHPALKPGEAMVQPPEPSWLRLAYCFEFLLALLVILVGWTQIGGQGHMDLMAWYVKLPSVIVLGWCAVRFTAAMVELPKAWNKRSRLWLMGLLLAATAMAGLTYYVHLHEAPDEPDTDETSTTSVRNLIPQSFQLNS
jgi:apolipoprotein N-acyltransferase